MPKPKVLVAAPISDDSTNKISENCDLIRIKEGYILPDGGNVAEHFDDAVGILCTIKSKFDTDLFDRFKRLRVVSNLAVGTDNIDIAAASAHKVLICNTPGVLDRAVADLTLGLVFMLSRRMLANDVHVRSGAWMRGPAALGTDIAGATLGLLGMGRIGAEVARLANAIGMRVIYHKPNRDTEIEARLPLHYRSREELFAEADFVSLHLPLNSQTEQSVGMAEFRRMKPSAYLINTARGPIIAEKDLVAALQEGLLAGAGLDVMEQEPLPAEHPFCAMDNVILQPHVGSATVETRRAMQDLAVENLIAAATGRVPPATVNP